MNSAIRVILREHPKLGVPHLKLYQEETLEALFSEKSVVTSVLPTGYGKTLILALYGLLHDKVSLPYFTIDLTDNCSSN
jgi:superfamily II DNA helicase RecQ